MFRRKRKYVSYAKEFQAGDTTPVFRRRSKGSRFFSDLIKIATLIPGIWAVINFIGLPAILWEYQYLGPKESRRDIVCTHIRIDGRIFRTAPKGERCALIAFFDAD